MPATWLNRVVLALSLGAFSMAAQACTRVVYHGEDGLNITGRTMDWKDPMHSRLWLFPAGRKENGAAGKNSAEWTARYGSVVVTSLHAAVSDGMNQKGLNANLLWLNSSKYPDQCPADAKRLAISAWAQYFLDNFATVDAAVASLKTHPVCLISAPIPGTDRFTTLHLSLSDASGNSAILEYIDGKLVVHAGRQYQVMTNDPEYPQQLAVAQYWSQIGGTRFLPGTNQAPDRFARADFYIHAIPKTANNQQGVGGTRGTVVKIGIFATRIATGTGEEVSIPNAVVFSQPIRNFSREGVGKHHTLQVAVSIGYSTPWRQVQSLLLTAGQRCPGLVNDPPPYVLQRQLSDFYVEYLLVACFDIAIAGGHAQTLSRLHAEVLDVFNENGVQIMSPHFMANTPEPELVTADNPWSVPAHPPLQPKPQ